MTLYDSVELTEDKEQEFDFTSKAFIDSKSGKIIYTIHTVSHIVGTHNYINCDTPEEADRIYKNKLKKLI